MAVRSPIKRFAALALLVVLLAGVAVAKGKPESSLLIDVDDLVRIVSEGDVVILDIRDEHSYVDGHIPGAILLPFPAVDSAARGLQGLDASIITYCSCPAEESSLAAALQLRGAGIENVFVLVGGYPEWVKQQRPVIQGANPL